MTGRRAALVASVDVADDRGRIEALTPATCWSLLGGASVGRIALRAVDDEIEIYPINFVVDGASIVFKTAPGTKLALVSQTARSTFEADDFDFYEGTAWSVVAKGTTEIVDDGPMIRTWQQGHKPMYVRLTPDAISGRRFPIDPDANVTA